MPLIFDHIIGLQRRFSFFNFASLTSEQIIAWAWELGVIPIKDHSVPYAKSFQRNGQKVILYNHHLPEFALTLALAHELGHVLLGHIENGRIFSLSDPAGLMADKRQKERDASTIAYLCLVPTPEMVRLAGNGIQTPQELFAELQPMFGDHEKLGMHICIERIRIFNRLLEICGGKCLKGKECDGCPDITMRAQQIATHHHAPLDGIPIVAAHWDVGPGEEYRFRNDPPHVIRIRWMLPADGVPVRLLLRDVPVAGISFDESRVNAGNFVSAKNRSLQLVRDPRNPFDKNAIKVIGCWVSGRGKMLSGQIGWIPKGIAADLAKERGELLATAKTLFRPIGNRGPGVRFDIWTKE